MRTVGLITEYNPFHNGHLHHLQESLRTTAAVVSVAVMSGHFLQRGEPALVDKWVRAKMALAAGVDVVVELPLPWACSSAPDFARGAVQSLSALGGVDSLCFGSETGELQALKQCAEVLLQQDENIARQTSRLLRDGVNYPQARAQLLAELLPETLSADALAAPNNILAIEYLKALQSCDCPIMPYTIKRIGAGFHDTAIGAQNIASATGIRKRLAEGSSIAELIPAKASQPLFAALQDGMSYCQEHYVHLLLAQILRLPAELADLWLVENGIENRLLAVAEQATSLDELVGEIKTRQLTRTRIQRLLLAILLGISKDLAAELLSSAPGYLHLLAVSEKGRTFLAKTREQRQLPLIHNFSRVYSVLKRHYGAETPTYRLAFQQLELELRATRMYTLLVRQFRQKQRNRDFSQPLVGPR